MAAGVRLSSWRKDAVLALVMLVVLAWVAKTVYGWLMPLVPSLLVILGLLAMLGVLLKLRQR